MMVSEDYETMHRVLERSKVLNDLIHEMELDMPPLPAALEDIDAYRVRRYAEECFYRETLTAPDLELYDSYEAKHPAGMQAALAAGANPDLPICWECSPLASDAVRCGWAEGQSFCWMPGLHPWWTKLSYSSPCVAMGHQAC